MFDFIERFKNWIDGLDLDFCRWRYPAMGVSAALMVLTYILFFTVGPNWGTDFTGGTEIHLAFDEPVPIEELRKGLVHLGLGDDAVQAVNGNDSGQFVVRIADPTFGMDGLEVDVRKALTDLYGPTWIKGMVGSAEVSARFLVDYEGPYKEYAQVARDLQKVFPGASAAPGKEELQVAINIPGLGERIKQRIASEMGDHTFRVLSTDSVGPKVGADLRRQGFISMIATLALILVYVAFRFDFEYAPGAVIALLHDITLTTGVFIVFQLDFTLGTIGALLTILGYSINDTIVIYDRIRENRDKFRRTDTVTLINKSVSETLTRTFATSFTVFIALLAFLIWGGPVLRDFAIAMLCGLVFGTYSTVYIASPFIIIFEDLKPTFAKYFTFAPDPEGPSPEGGDDPASTAPLTESEKRRRTRAESEKRELLG